MCISAYTEASAPAPAAARVYKAQVYLSCRQHKSFQTRLFTPSSFSMLIIIPTISDDAKAINLFSSLISAQS